MDVDHAYDLIERAVRAGRVANAYLLVGGVRGMAGELADRVLHLLFGPGDLRVHPDIHRLAPAKKTRIISVDAMRERMIDPMEKTTFMGGWKAGVVLGSRRRGRFSSCFPNAPNSCFPRSSLVASASTCRTRVRSNWRNRIARRFWTCLRGTT